MKEEFRKKDFEAKIQAHLSALRLTALWLTKDRSDSMNLVHMTLVKAYRVWHPSFSETNLKVLLFKILTSLFFDDFQQKTKKSMIDGRVELKAMTLRNRFAIRESETDRITQRTIVRLPIEIRYVRVLSKLAGLSHLDVAKIIGLNPNIIESKSFRGSRLLQSELFTYGEG